MANSPIWHQIKVDDHIIRYQFKNGMLVIDVPDLITLSFNPIGLSSKDLKTIADTFTAELIRRGMELYDSLPPSDVDDIPF